MPTHTTPPPHADQTDLTAEPARRAPRFDERGIALQTIIIMVVLLAIAGSVAAVILSRAGEETSRLEGQSDTAAYGITNKRGCEVGGNTWTEDKAVTALTAAQLTGHTADIEAGLKGAGLTASAVQANEGYCKPTT